MVSILTTTQDLIKVKADALVFFLFENEKLYREAKALDIAIKKKLFHAIETKEFEGKLNQIEIIHAEGIGPTLVVLSGLGEKEKFDLEKFRQSAATTASAVQILKKTNIFYHLRQFERYESTELARVAVEGAILATFVYEDFKTKKDGLSPLETIGFVGEPDKKKLELSRIYAETTNYARELGNTPGNKATPKFISEKAKELSKKYGLYCKIFEKSDMEKEGMEGILSVSQGSNEPPKFILLKYTHPKAKVEFALVGKGITFDAGGISIKPSENLDKMKYDKCGACTVLGIFKAIAEAKLPFRLIGLIPCAENLPSGSAIKPGDLIRPYKGKTVEIIDTDAEGRMILADALSYAKEFKPDAIIDFATLTGACRIALGSIAMGMMGTDENLKKKIKIASDLSGEKVWELPLFEEYEAQLESEVADIKNVGGHEAGAITGALFLKNFIGNCPWVHLDIAGTAAVDMGGGVSIPLKALPYFKKGATGSGIRLICYLMENWK